MNGHEVIILKLLRPNVGKRRWLEQTQQTYAQALSDGLEAARIAEATERSQVQHLSYRAARQCGLPGAMARAAADEVLSAFRRQETAPFGEAGGFGLGAQGYQIRQSEKSWVLRVSTGEGKDFLWFPLHVPEKFQERLVWVSGDARLFRRKDDWYVRLPVHRPWKPAPVLRPGEEHTFIGIDLGVVRLVTLAAPKQVFIFRGLALRQRRQWITELCRDYAAQGKHSLGSKLRGKERRWMAAINHQVSRQIVDLAGEFPNPSLVLERLTGLRKASQSTSRTSSLQQAWNFRQLVEFVCYKAQEAGIKVIFVDPRGTSTTCPKCGYYEQMNIPIPGRFRCAHCDYQANSDVVAARNIAQRGQKIFPYPFSKKLSPG